LGTIRIKFDIVAVLLSIIHEVDTAAVRIADDNHHFLVRTVLSSVLKRTDSVLLRTHHLHADFTSFLPALTAKVMMAYLVFNLHFVQVSELELTVAPNFHLRFHVETCQIGPQP